MSSFPTTAAVRRPLAQLLLALTLGAASSAAFAIPIMDMKVEDLMPMGPDFMQELKLNDNQARLWRQVESKTRQVMRARRERRERLEGGLKQALVQPKLELRDLVGGLDAETTTTAAEEKGLREMWLEVNDALNEQQRQQVGAFIAGQMSRVMDGAPPPHDDGGKRDKGDGGGRGGRPGGGGGGGGGMGGMGLNVGGNGATGVTVPGSF